MMIKAAKQTREEKLERGRQYRRQYRLKHREKVLESNRQYRLDHPAEEQERKRQYYQEHKGQRRKSNHAHRGPKVPLPVSQRLDSRPSPIAALAGYRRLAYETLLGGFQELAEEVKRGCEDEEGVDELIEWILDTEWVQSFTGSDPARLRTVIDRILGGWVPPNSSRHQINRRVMGLTPAERRPHPLGKKALWRE